MRLTHLLSNRLAHFTVSFVGGFRCRQLSNKRLKALDAVLVSLEFISNEKTAQVLDDIIGNRPWILMEALGFENRILSNLIKQYLYYIMWLYYATIYLYPPSSSIWVILSCHNISNPLSSSIGVIISCHNISTPLSTFLWVIISCHNISTTTLYFHRSDYIMPRYIHSDYLVL